MAQNRPATRRFACGGSGERLFLPSAVSIGYKGRVEQEFAEQFSAGIHEWQVE
jgi:hypothetical protein